MEKKEFIDALNALTEKEGFSVTGKEISALRIQFEDYLLEATRQYQIAELKAKDEGEAFDEEDWMTSLKEEFYSIYGPFKEKQKALKAAIRNEEEENLKKKRVLINQLKEVINKEENIGAAFSAHKEINKKWKAVGDIPRSSRHDMQQEYSRLLEEFFYNINIYKEIKDYDIKKNYETKKSLVEQLKKLSDNENIKEVEANIKKLQNEWEDIGPTKQELWEELKEDYWSTVKTIYDRIRSYYNEKREQKQENLVKKKGLIEKMKSVLELERDSVKEWNKHTNEVLDIQKEWKTIGFGPRKQNEEVWKNFRGLCDEFFDQKSEFFEEAQEEFDKIAVQKEKLIEKVDQLKDSTEWKDTAYKIIEIQKQWKKTGNAGRKNEPRLWKKFRAICNHFFDAKKAHFEEQEKAYDDNLKAKETLVEELKSVKLDKDQEKSIEQLKDFSDRFAAIGFIPKSQKDAVYKSYKEVLDGHYDSLDIKGDKKEEILFEARINTLKGSSNSERLLENEKQTIRTEITAIKQQINQYENNLGFFANSKGANALKEEVEGKIAKEYQKIEQLKAKLKMIPNE